MRAVTITEPGRVEIAQHRDPRPGAGEMLVRVAAAGVNSADLLQLQGLYPAPPGSPADIPGLELAGEVVELGPGATRFGVGDRVMAVVGGGAQAELAVVHDRAAMPVPDRVPFLEAGGFPEAFTTAHDALVTQAGLHVGDRVLISGAAGGVGVAAVQLARCAGAWVCASVRAESVRAGVVALGADEAVDPAAVAVHGPFDLVLELVGAPNLRTDVDSLAVGGRIVVIGVGAGARGEINLHALMTRRGRIMASTLRARQLEEKALCARGVESDVLPLVAAGAVRVPVAASFPLADAPAAYERFAAGTKLGKVILVL